MDNIQPGQTIGPYQILNQVGQGGMATVYRAYHSAMDRYVALKLLPRKLAETPEFVGRFRQEAHTIARLEHAHILPVYDYGEAEGYTYLAMRYLEAGTLKDRLGQAALSLQEVDHLLSQLAAALHYAHARGVIHRDLKPSNVLLDASGNVFLTDFGIAKLLQGDANFTSTGAMIGTPAYMSPEQALGQPVDQRSDLYSLGIILYEMVTGRVPYEADTPLAVVLKHVNAPLPLPSSVKPGLPAGIEKVLLKALAKEQAERYATATEMLDAWRAALNEAPRLAPAVGLPLPAPTTVAAAAPTTVAVAAPAAPSEATSTQAKPPAARTASGWLALLGVGGALALLVCGGLVCGSLWLGQFLNSLGSGPSSDGQTPVANTTMTPVAVASQGDIESVQIPLEAGLPRSLTYAGLTYTVVEAVLDNVQPDDPAGTLASDRLYAHLSVSVENATTQEIYADPRLFRLHLAGGDEYTAIPATGIWVAPSSTAPIVVAFEVPSSARWEGALLGVRDTGHEPAELPLTGEAPPALFPKPLRLPAESEATAPDQSMAYRLLSAALDLDWEDNRAESGQRFLKLEVRLTNLGHPSGIAVGPAFFRLLVDGVPQAPLAAPIEVIDYNAALAGEVIFTVPADAASVELQLGDVTNAETEHVSFTLNLIEEQ